MNPEGSYEDGELPILQEADTVGNDEGADGLAGPSSSNAASSYSGYYHASHQTDSIPVEEDSGTEEDSDMEKELESSQSPSGRELSSSTTDESGRAQSEGVSLRRNSKHRTRKGGRGGRKVTIEEMIQRQETASQIHNENERCRRKELRSALLGLRNQLTRPTKRPAVKLVLEAAIQELKELENKQREDAKLVESLKDREKRLTFELESKLKDYSQAQQDSQPPATPQMPSPASSTIPQMPGNWLPIFSPSHTKTTLESQTSVPHQINPSVSPLLFNCNPWPLIRLPSQQLPTPPLNFGVPIQLSNLSPPHAHTPTAAQRLNMQPRFISSLYPFQTFSPSITPHTPIPVHSGLPVVRQLVASSEPPNIAQAGCQPQMLALVSQASPQVLTVPPQLGIESSRSHVASSEDSRIVTAISRSDSRSMSDRGRNGKQKSSKNGKESADKLHRPSIVVHYTTPADSEARSVQESRTAHSTEPDKHFDAHQVSSNELVDVEILEQPISTLDKETPPGLSIATKRGVIRSVREIPPLLKISDPGYKHVDTNIEVPSIKKLKTNSSLNNSEVVDVQWVSNPYFEHRPHNHQVSTRPRNEGRKRRCNSGCATDTDSSVSEEDYVYTPHQQETSPVHFQMHSKFITCPGNGVY